MTIGFLCNSRFSVVLSIHETPSRRSYAPREGVTVLVREEEGDCMPVLAVVQVATGPKTLKPPLECWQEVAVHDEHVWAELAAP